MVNEMYAIMAFVALVSAFIFGSYCHKNKEEDIYEQDGEEEQEENRTFWNRKNKVVSMPFFGL